MFVDKKLVLRFLDSVGAARYDSDGILLAAAPPGILRRASSSSNSRSSSSSASPLPSPFTCTLAPTTSAENENEHRDSNKNNKNKREKKRSSVSSSLKAIVKAGNRRGGRPPRIQTTVNTTKQTPTPTLPPPPSNAIQRQQLSCSSCHAFNGDNDIFVKAILSPVPLDNDERPSMMLDGSYDDSDMIPTIEAIPIPGFPVFSDFGSATTSTYSCCSSSRGSDTPIAKGRCISPTMDDTTIATSSAVTSTSISSSSSSSAVPNTILEDNDGFQNALNNDNVDDLLLALAGCARSSRRRRHHTGIDDSYFHDHEDDRLLSGLLICDDESYNGDEGRDKSHTSACSMLTYSSSHSDAYIGTNTPCGIDTGNADADVNANVNANANTNIDCNDSISTTHQDNTSSAVSCATTNSTSTTTPHLMPSFFETITSLASVSSLGAPSRHGKNGMFLESSSLLQGPEREMATILESVLDCIFVPDNGNNKNTVGAEDDFDYEYVDDHHHHDTPGTIGVVQTKNLDTSHLLYHEISNYPCPTPQELLAMDWNR